VSGKHERDVVKGGLFVDLVVADDIGRGFIEAARTRNER